MGNETKLVYGIGFNDGKYPAKVGGKMTVEYNTWTNLLQRCREKYWKEHPTYIGVSCSENFKSYSFFYEWYHTQTNASAIDSDGKMFPLDKDLLFKGNKVYSEHNCSFIPQRINKLLTGRSTFRGDCPLGVSWCKVNRKYKASCSDGKGNQKTLGYYTTQKQAFNIYKTFKEALIKEVANEYKEQLDPRAYEALMNYSVEVTD
jgi:hypothetical protein